jgi:glycine/D-amino acid oxidase-like deaminating enzyme
MDQKNHEVVIVGAGMAGLTCAYHLSEAVRQRKWQAFTNGRKIAWNFLFAERSRKPGVLIDGR